MLITNKLVVLNFPKTGSSFIRKILKKIHHVDNYFGKHILYRGIKINGIKELIIPSNLSVYQNKKRGQHSTYSQIPPRYADRIILTAIRNPFERYVSAYEYKWYARNSYYKSNKEVLSKYPHFPNISFKEYLDISFNYGVKQFYNKPLNGLEIGSYSLQFIRFFYPNAESLIDKLVSKKIDIQELANQLPKIHFLKTENLNNELYDFLLKTGYKAKKIQFILEEKKVNKSNWKHSNWIQYYDNELIEKVKNFDQLIFSLFPNYNLDNNE